MNNQNNQNPTFATPSHFRLCLLLTKEVRRAVVLDLPSLKVVLEKPLPAYFDDDEDDEDDDNDDFADDDDDDDFNVLHEPCCQSFYFLRRTYDALRAYDIRTFRRFAEFPLPGEMNSHSVGVELNFLLTRTWEILKYIFKFSHGRSDRKLRIEIFKSLQIALIVSSTRALEILVHFFSIQTPNKCQFMDWLSKANIFFNRQKFRDSV